MLQAVFKALPLLLLEIDQEGIILDYRTDSPSHFDVHPVPSENYHLRDFFPDQVSHELDIVVRGMRRRIWPHCINYSIHHAGEERWFEARFIPSDEEKWIVILQDITGYRLKEVKIRKQLRQMSALRAIDQAITSSEDLRLTLSILLTQLLEHLHVDAASILLWNPEINRLEFAAGLGFQTDSLRHTKLKLGEGYAGIAALEKRIIHKGNLTNQQTDFLRSSFFHQEGFVSYFGIPLVAKGETQGVLEIYKRSHITPDDEWLKFLEMLGGQAAIAIDNAMLFNNLQRTNIELTSAYNATIDGWSRALDLRDHETEGHTQRVAQITLSLAGKFSIADDERVHLHRGAMLHDIGKMGIPDSILHKPGPLTKEEWGIMRQHPQYAYELLSPISYLRPAMDIPRYHHERWDGSGYPFGLKGGDIPLAARLFAVVDVFDALTSDRPYRSAWSKSDAIQYIRDHKSRLFDESIVSVFVDVVEAIAEEVYS